MPRNRKRDARPSESAASRIRLLLEKIWEGSQTRMSKETGLTQGAISNVVRDKIPPGRDFLLAVAAHPQVNPGWLLTGEGEPLGGKLLALPVAKMLLAGSPKDYLEKLTGEMRPVDESQYRRSRYWLQLQRDDVDALPENVDIRCGDWVVVETAARYWKQTGRNTGERACVIRVDWANDSRLLVGVVDRDGRVRTNEPTIIRTGNSGKAAKIEGRPLRRLVLEGADTPETEETVKSRKLEDVTIVGVITGLWRDLEIANP